MILLHDEDISSASILARRIAVIYEDTRPDAIEAAIYHLILPYRSDHRLLVTVYPDRESVRWSGWSARATWRPTRGLLIDFDNDRDLRREIWEGG